MLCICKRYSGASSVCQMLHVPRFYLRPMCVLARPITDCVCGHDQRVPHATPAARCQSGALPACFVAYTQHDQRIAPGALKKHAAHGLRPWLPCKPSPLRLPVAALVCCLPIPAQPPVAAPLCGPALAARPASAAPLAAALVPVPGLMPPLASRRAPALVIPTMRSAVPTCRRLVRARSPVPVRIPVPHLPAMLAAVGAPTARL